MSVIANNLQSLRRVKLELLRLVVWKQLSGHTDISQAPNTTGRALIVILNLACCSIGKQKVIETGGIEVLLAAINNHLKSDNLASSMHCSVQHDPEKKREEEKYQTVDQSGRCHRCHVSKEWPNGSMGETSQVDWKRND
jgi:hypothetical protein